MRCLFVRGVIFPSFALRWRFAEAVDDPRSRIETLSRQRSIPMLLVATDRDPPIQLRETLGHRAPPSRAPARRQPPLERQFDE
jgi:hypothetical protein